MDERIKDLLNENFALNGQIHSAEVKIETLARSRGYWQFAFAVAVITIIFMIIL